MSFPDFVFIDFILSPSPSAIFFILYKFVFIPSSSKFWFLLDSILLCFYRFHLKSLPVSHILMLFKFVFQSLFITNLIFDKFVFAWVTLLWVPDSFPQITVAVITFYYHYSYSLGISLFVNGVAFKQLKIFPVFTMSLLMSLHSLWLFSIDRCLQLIEMRCLFYLFSLYCYSICYIFPLNYNFLDFSVVTFILTVRSSSSSKSKSYCDFFLWIYC